MARLSLLAATIIMPSCAFILVVSSMNLATSRSSADETKMTVAYSCAFLAGQYAMMNRMPTLFPGDRDTPEYCKPFEKMAEAHGFNQH